MSASSPCLLFSPTQDPSLLPTQALRTCTHFLHAPLQCQAPLPGLLGRQESPYLVSYTPLPHGREDGDGVGNRLKEAHTERYGLGPLRDPALSPLGRDGGLSAQGQDFLPVTGAGCWEAPRPTLHALLFPALLTCQRPEPSSAAGLPEACPPRGTLRLLGVLSPLPPPAPVP